jgi:uncharacterized protein YpuA (DUF1002 family)
MPKRAQIQKEHLIQKIKASTPEGGEAEIRRIVDYCNETVNAFNEVDKHYTKVSGELEQIKHQIEKVNAVLRRAGFQERVKPDTLSSTISHLLWKIRNVYPTYPVSELPETGK